MRKTFSFSELKEALRTTGLTKTAAAINPGELTPGQVIENICSIGDTLDAHGFEQLAEKLTASIQALLSFKTAAENEENFELSFKCPECGAEIVAEIEIESEEQDEKEKAGNAPSEEEEEEEEGKEGKEEKEEEEEEE
jgi:hypothetical protein